MPQADTLHAAAKNAPARARRRRVRRTFHILLVFVSCVLVADALVGEKGLIESIKARRRYAQLAATIAELERENARLQEDARRLREDPSAIEEVARKELGLIRSGELLVIVKDVPLPARRRE